MTILRYTQEINRPVHDVFACVIDAGEFASWNPTIESSRRLDAGEIAAGSAFEWKLRGFGWVRQHLEEFERERRVRIVPEMKSLGGGHWFTGLGGWWHVTDNGEGTAAPPDITTFLGIGSLPDTTAFCLTHPAYRFPFPIDGGSIQVRG